MSFATPMSTPRSPPAYSTPDRSRSLTSSVTCAGRGSRCAMLPDRIDALAWDKQAGLLPAIVQDADGLRVLMLGYMDRAALQATIDSGRVTFFSRSRQRLWVKGEVSGHYLALVAVEADCDNDTLLVQARPVGPTCHLGTQSCFATAPGDVLAEL